MALKKTELKVMVNASKKWKPSIVLELNMHYENNLRFFD